MAFTVEAHWEQTNNFGVTDRIEIQQDAGDGSNISLSANDTGFRFSHSEITADSDEGYISVFENRIQEGKLDFFPRIDPTVSAEASLISDILGADDQAFKLVWKRDGSVYWQGFIDTRRSSKPEKGSTYTATIRARDFEVLKGIDFTLEDNRVTLISILSQLLGNLGFGINIKTATSWINDNTTDATDFLSQIYLDTYALRSFGRGDESDQPITVFDAINEVLSAGLVLRQIDGVFTVEQVSEFNDPTAVNETVYDSSGAVVSATGSVDRTQAGYKDVGSGKPVIKVSSNNDSFPGLKRARVTYNHRSVIGNLTLPSNIFISGAGQEVYTDPFVSTGNQKIKLSALVQALDATDNTSGDADIEINVGQYWFDGNQWTTNSVDRVTVDLTNTGFQVEGGTNQYVYQSSVDILTPTVPSDATSPITVKVNNAVINASPDVVADETSYQNITFAIVDQTNSDNQSTSFDYQLTQTQGYPTVYELPPSIFGDGPRVDSPGALRHGTANNNITANDWQRRGDTGSRSFFKNLLKDALDLQRGRVRKLRAEIYGEYNPEKILQYDSINFYYVGGSYKGNHGRWSVVLMEVNLQTGSDTFEEIVRFDPGTITTTGTGGGAGLDTTTTDARYLRVLNNLSDLDSASNARTNLGVAIGTDVQAHSANLDTYDANPLTASELAQLQNINATTITNTQWGYVGGLDQGLSTSDAVTFATVNTGQGDNELYPMDQPVLQSSSVTFGGVTDSSLTASRIVGTNGAKALTSVDLASWIAGTANQITVSDDGDGSVTLSLPQDHHTSAEVTYDDLALNDGLTLADTDGFISSQTFVSGFAGAGMEVRQGSGTWDATVDNLTVRERMRIYELLINQIRASNGSVWVSSADRVDSQAQQFGETQWSSSTQWSSATTWRPTYRCFVGDDQFVNFSEDDLVRAQRFTGRGTYVVKGTVVGVENGDPDVTINTTSRYFDLALEPGSDTPAAEMEFVRIGNRANTSRQGAIYLSSDDADSPFMDVIDGVSTHEEFGTTGKTKLRIGRLDGLTTSDFGDLDGTQTDLFGAALMGNIYVKGVIKVTQSPSADDDAASKSYVDTSVSTAFGNEIQRSASEPTTRSDGSALVVGDIWEDTGATVGTDQTSIHMWNGSAFVDAFTVISGGSIATGSVTASQVATSTLTTAELNFTPLTSTSGTNDIIATINASSEGITIDADNLTINASTTFASGYDPTNKTKKTDGIAIISQDAEPSTRASGDALQDGDRWVDTNDSNKVYEWNGTSFTRDWTTIDGGSIQTNTVSLSTLNFTPLTSTSGTNDIIATINASAEGIKVQGSKLDIDVTAYELNAGAGDLDISSSSKAISLNDATFGNAGIQLQYNSGSSRFYAGNGSGKFLKYDGTNISWDGGSSSLSTAGHLTTTSATIGGFDIDSTTLSGITTSGGVEIDSSARSIKIYEDNGTTERVTIDSSGSLPSSATVRDSASASGVTVDTTNTIVVVDRELIDGSVTVKNQGTNPPNSESIDVVYQGDTGGGTWSDIRRTNLSIVDGNNITLDFSFSNLTTYSKFRVRLENPTGGVNFDITDYSFQQYLSETRLNDRGLAVLGGQMHLVDFPIIGNDDVDIRSNQVALEDGGDGYYYMRVKK